MATKSFSLSPAQAEHRLAIRLRTLRLKANMSQMDLAQKVGVSLSSIRRLEDRGQATVRLLFAVIRELGIWEELNTLLDTPPWGINDKGEPMYQRSSVKRKSLPPAAE